MSTPRATPRATRTAAGQDSAEGRAMLIEAAASLAVPLRALRATPTSASADALVCLWELRRLTSEPACGYPRHRASCRCHTLPSA